MPNINIVRNISDFIYPDNDASSPCVELSIQDGRKPFIHLIYGDNRMFSVGIDEAKIIKDLLAEAIQRYQDFSPTDLSPTDPPFEEG